MPPRAQKLPDTSDLIGARLVEAAERVFLRDGFVRASVESIVREAGTSKREFYRCFADKDSVFVRVVERIIAANKLVPVISPSGPLEQVLFDIARRTYTSHLTDRSVGLYRASISAAPRSPALARSVYESRARASEAVAKVLESYRQREHLVFDDAFLSSLRFSFLAIDGLRYLMGAEHLSPRQQRVQATGTVEVYLNGHVTTQFRRGRVADRVSPTCRTLSSSTQGAEISRVQSSRLGDTKWNEVLDAAWATFVERGYEGASFEAISRKTGVARTTLYRQFETKESLFREVAERMIDRHFGIELQLGSGKSTVQSALHRMGTTILDAYLHPDNIALQRILLAEAGVMPAQMHALYERMVGRITALAEPLLEALVEAGVLRAELLPKAVRRFFVLTAFGGRFLYVPPRNRAEREALTREAVATFLYGCRRPT